MDSFVIVCLARSAGKKTGTYYFRSLLGWVRDREQALRFISETAAWSELNHITNYPSADMLTKTVEAF
jgi:hypothetical protein